MGAWSKEIAVVTEKGRGKDFRSTNDWIQRLVCVETQR